MLTVPHSHVGSTNYEHIGNRAASHTFGQRMQRVRQQANPNALVTSTQFAGTHPVGGLQSLAFTFLGGLALGYALRETDAVWVQAGVVAGAGLVGERATSEITNGYAAAAGALLGLMLNLQAVSRRSRTIKGWSQGLF